MIFHFYHESASRPMTKQNLKFNLKTSQVAMEYMDGGALTEVISICQITEPQIACICKEVRKVHLFFHCFF